MILRCLTVATFALAPMLLAGAPARADETSDRHAAATLLLQQMHLTDNMTGLSTNIVAQVRQAVTQGDPDLNKTFDGFAPKLLADADKAKAQLVDQVMTVYEQKFTSDELKQMAAFYQTPLGQKIVSTEVPISAEILRLEREWGNTLAQKMAAEARDNLQNAQ